MSAKGTAPSAKMAAAPGKLKHARNNGIERQRVSDIQRARVVTAMAEAACEHGGAHLTVTHIVARAGVSRRTFYELFDDIRDCLLATIEEAVRRLAARVLPAYEQPGRWHEQIRAALIALLSFLDEEPHMGHLLIVESLAAGRRALERRARVLKGAIAAVDAGRGEAKAAPGTTRLTAEGVVGAVLAVIHSRLLEGRREPLIELVNPLMSMVTLPYLGPAAARRELERRPASPAIRRRVAAGNPLRDVHMRLTYRTVRVLLAVAANPGSSNRAIADVAEISDQGQISKLLSRLERLGLIENAGAGMPRGEPNAWTLTQRGWQVHGALGERTVRA
jgi:AcrR family transcriptional regulator